jgi:hypothetical protein
MFCSGCGQTLVPGQAICPQCGRQMTPSVPPVPGLDFQVQNYAGRIRALSVVWFIYAAYIVLKGFLGMAFFHAFTGGQGGWWMNGPWAHSGMPPMPFGHAIYGLIWVSVITHAALAAVAGWGLMERAQWGRILAIIAAIYGLLSIPFGTALGIWTLVVLLGCRNSTLYEHL